MLGKAGEDDRKKEGGGKGKGKIGERQIRERTGSC